jgi:hypothetical protein
MSSRRGPSGPLGTITGFVAFAQTVVAPGSAGNLATATGIAAQFRAPGSTAVVPINPRRLTTNDIVKGSPRGTVPLGTSQVGVAYMRVSSIGSASAVIEIAYTNPSTASASAVANTWNVALDLQKSDGNA